MTSFSLLNVILILAHAQGGLPPEIDIRQINKTQINHEKVPVSRNQTETPDLVKTASPTFFNPYIPTHSFWPLVPVAGAGAKTRSDHPKQLFRKKLPTHSFWPWIPMKGSGVKDSLVSWEKFLIT